MKRGGPGCSEQTDERGRISRTQSPMGYEANIQWSQGKLPARKTEGSVAEKEGTGRWKLEGKFGFFLSIDPSSTPSHNFSFSSLATTCGDWEGGLHRRLGGSPLPPGCAYFLASGGRVDGPQPGERQFSDEALISNFSDHHSFKTLCDHKNYWDYSTNDNIPEFSVMLDLGVSQILQQGFRVGQYVKVLLSNTWC